MEREGTAVVVEDDEDVASLICLVLEQAGLRVIQTGDGAAGLQAVRDHDPLLTTLDVNLPGADGFAVARALREFSDTYLIMVTGMVGEVDIVRGFEAGADDYLVKPFRPRELRARADAMVRRHRRWERQHRAAPLGVAAGAAPVTPVAPVTGQHGVSGDGSGHDWVRAAAVDMTGGPDGAVRPDPVAPVVAVAPVVLPAPVAAPVAPVVAAPVAPVVPVAPAHVRAPASVGVAGEPVVGPDGAVHSGPITLHPGTRQVALRGRPVALSQLELDLLLSLMTSGRKVRSKGELALTVRGESTVVSRFVNEAEKRVVDSHIASLRTKLGDTTEPAALIEPVHGVGYRMTHRS